MSEVRPQGLLAPRRVFAEMWTVYRRHWAFLVVAALVVLLPQTVADALLEGGFHVDHIRNLADAATVGLALLTAAVNLMGQAVYAGLTAAAVVDWRARQPLPPLSDLLRSMPIGRLILLDVVVTIGAAIGFVLLVVPALIFLTYVAASAPLMKLEHLGVRESLRRSIGLVRGQARRVFVIVAGTIVVTEFAVQAIIVPLHGTVVLVLAGLTAEAIFQPFEGLAVALVAVHLLELHGQAPEPEKMARALVEEHD
jgi:hypothetical protein